MKKESKKLSNIESVLLREIKFRLWYKKNKIMYKPYDILSISLDYIDWMRGDSNDIVFLQYTGLNDKNGINIYEGDIIRFRDPLLLNKGGSFIGYVYFELGCFMVKLEGQQNVVSDLLLFRCFNGMLCKDGVDNRTEVIGNIFENPELLETTSRPH